MRLGFSLIAAGLAAGVVSVGAQDAGQARALRAPGFPTAYQGRSGPERTEHFSRKIKIGRDGRVTVNNVAGDIVVTGGPGDEVSIEAIKRTRGDSSQLAGVQIDIDERADHVGIRTMYTSSHDRMVAVDYTIAVPSSASVDLKSISGNLKIVGVQGSVRAETVDGSVTASATSKLEMAKAVSGDVDLSDVGADGDLTAASVSGNVRVKGLKGHSLNLGTVSGDLTLSNVACDRLGARSVSGNVEYAGTLTKNGRYDLNSHSGTVRLALDGTTGFELNASSFNGSIRSELPLTTSNSPDSGRADQGRSGRGRVLNDHSMRATFRDASATLTVRTFSGDIVIAKGK